MNLNSHNPLPNFFSLGLVIKICFMQQIIFLIQDIHYTGHWTLAPRVAKPFAPPLAMLLIQ
jgi:hypothetical protein